MRITFLCLFMMFAVWPAQAQSDGECRISLNGVWDFTTSGSMRARKDFKWDSMSVPGNWDVQASYSTHVGEGWYRRMFQVPADWKGKKIRLHFDAVYHEARVWLNGREIGGHVGGYTPFEFDVSDMVLPGIENTVVVCANNQYHRGAWWAWGGISRNVTLIANNDVRLVWQHVNAQPDLQSGTARIFVRYKLMNAGATERLVQVSSAIGEAPDAGAGCLATLIPNTAKTVETSFTLPKAMVRLWDFDHPNLYAIHTRIVADGKILHSKSDRFGIRKVEIKPEGLWLNGERVRLVGFNRVSDSREHGNTEPDELVRKDVDLMKRCGANMARLMHVPQAPNLLDYLDEKGMLIFAEIPVWGERDPQVVKDSPLAKQWLTEMIERDYNHPCIIGWSPGNEITQHYEYVRSMLEYVRANLDSSRLLAYVSFTGARKNSTRENDPITEGDLALINAYGGFGAVAGALHKCWPEKPVFFSEWGYKQIGEKPDSCIPNFEKSWAETVQGHPYVIGISIWTFNDYRSNFKGTPSSGNRAWGVVDVRRHPKAAYEQARRVFCPVRGITVDDGKICVTPRMPDDVPCYALRGYKIQWEKRNADGFANKSGTISLPEILPGEKVWTAPFNEGADVVLRLITPTGYDVAEFHGK